MGMKDFHGQVQKLEDTPFGYTVSLIGGKWKMVIIYLIAENQPIRYNHLYKYIGTISHKTLSQQLNELEINNLIIRKEFLQIPPKVEYTLSEKGASLMPCLEQLCYWGLDHMDETKRKDYEKTFKHPHESIAK